MQNGGCHPVDKCLGPHPFPGAKFRYLAASTFEKATGKTVFPAYDIRTFDGIQVAFIGLTLKGTPNIISPESAAGLEFRDEAETVNALIPELKARGVEAIVVLIHDRLRPHPARRPHRRSRGRAGGSDRGCFGPGAGLEADRISDLWSAG